jgi:hypothetical protein
MTSNTPTNLQSLYDSLTEITPGDKVLIERAYYKAENAHAGQCVNQENPILRIVSPSPRF